MSVYKKIESVDRTSNVIHYEHFLSASTEGLSSISFISGSTNNKYWNSLNVLFYTSGSPTLNNKINDVDQFNLAHTNFTIKNSFNPQHTNKFHPTRNSRLFQISQYYYGDRIKPGTFELVDKSSGQNITIKDDGYGNLYPVNNTISHSTNSPSSSDNYLGNIFYDYGIVVISETGSYTHTASTGSITVGTMTDTAGINRFHITGSTLTATDTIRFISTGSYASETDVISDGLSPSTVHFGSGSTTTNTAISGAKKINDIFAGLDITASNTANVINLTNDANQLINRVARTAGGDNLPPISGAGAVNTTAGFGGGTSDLRYHGTDMGTNYTIRFNSTNTVHQNTYKIKIENTILLVDLKYNTLQRAI